MTASNEGAKDQGVLSMLRHCLNPKVLIGLGAAGLVIWLVQPQLIRPILPVLFLLACPLSMVLMMRAMHRPSDEEDSKATAVSGATVAPDRATELKERLTRARAEQEVVQSEIERLDAIETPASDGGDGLPRSQREGPPR